MKVEPHRMGLTLITNRAERVEQVKHEIALGEYKVDAAAVAEAILAKLELVRQGQLALAGADRSHVPPDLHRRAA